MNKTIGSSILACCLLLTGTPNIIASLGLGSYGFGITEEIPLGNINKVHQRLLKAGFYGDIGTSGTARTINYQRTNHSKSNPNHQGIVQVAVAKDGSVEMIQGTFSNSDHTKYPGAENPTAVLMVNLWGIAFATKPIFESNNPIGIEPSKYHATKVAKQQLGQILGEWQYSEHGLAEVIKLSRM